MFARTIIDSDAFLDMPTSAQALYFHLSMRADDDGFINNPKKIQRMIGASDDDIKLLLMKRFVIAFDSGVVVIKHWKIHNYIQNDRYKPTIYEEEKAQLEEKENKAYTELKASGMPDVSNLYPSCIQAVSNLDTQVRLDKDRLELDKDSIEDKADKPPRAARFTPPTLEEVRAYCAERGSNVDPERFIDFYSSKGWMVGKNKMKDWKAAIRGWESRSGQAAQQQKSGGDRLLDMIRSGTFDE